MYKYLLLFLLVACPKVEKVGEIEAPTAKSSSLKKAADPWWMQLSPAIYIAQLTEVQRREYNFLINELLCPCGDHAELFATCIEANACPEALQAASTAARLLSFGVDRSVAEALIVDSFGGPPVSIPIDGSPVLGNANAPVTIVDFADFQCPYCAKLSAELHKVVASRTDVRLVFKYFPIPSHPFAYLSAEAAAFAHSKGKFWELHDLLFSRQDEMSRDAILSWAKEVGLDAATLEASWGEAIFSERVKRDSAEGRKIGVQGTPSLYINGRPYHESMSAKDINRAIDEAIYASKAVVSSR